MSDKTIVIIPAYNESRGIAAVIARIRELYPQVDVLVIDDGSTDGTTRIAAAAGALVLKHCFNMSYGSTIQTGYKYAYRNGYDYLVQIDGDGQHEIEDIGKLLDEVKAGRTDLALGSRFLEDCGYRHSTLRQLGMQFFQTILKVLIKRDISDPTSGFQAMNRKVLKVFIQDFFPCDYPDADVIVLLDKLQLRVNEVPVRMYSNGEGKSMHSKPFDVIYYVFKMVVSVFLTKYRKISAAPK
jgi:glycosyltransferase involved in cell wall biosynthesis